MLYKYILSAIALLILSNSIDAQKVKRKGTTPLMKKPRQEQQVASFMIEQLSGKWQETERMNRDDQSRVDIKDTIYLNFTENGKVDTKEGNNPTVKGAAEIDPDNTLTVAADFYTIKSVTENEMVLDDNDAFIHKFQKKDLFWLDTVGKDSVSQSKYTTVIQISMADLFGQWMVYKRTAKPGAVSPASPVIRYLSIVEKTGDDTAKGVITFYKKDSTQELPCIITFYKTGIQVEAGKYNWYLPVYKADGKELVFGNYELMLYYCKPLK